MACVANATAASDDLANFRKVAIGTLVRIGLADTGPDAFVCITIDRAAPAESELSEFRSLGLRDVGPPADCACVERSSGHECTRVGSVRKACSVSLHSFELKNETHATATVVASCGWPDGGGHIEGFEKQDGKWVFVGSQGRIVF